MKEFVELQDTGHEDNIKWRSFKMGHSYVVSFETGDGNGVEVFDLDRSVCQKKAALVLTALKTYEESLHADISNN